MISRIRVIALIGAGAISSAGICSLYIAYTLSSTTADPFPMIGLMPLAEDSENGEENFESAKAGTESDNGLDISAEGDQSFLVAFLADADPQVRTLAAWGLMSEDEDRQEDLLDFVRHEKDPEVRAALFRYLQTQRPMKCQAIVELVRQEEHKETWLAGCDLLAGVVQKGALPETVTYFDESIVPKLRQSAVSGTDLHERIGAIIALKRAKTSASMEALQEVVETSTDVRVVRAASSAVGYVASDR